MEHLSDRIQHHDHRSVRQSAVADRRHHLLNPAAGDLLGANRAELGSRRFECVPVAELGHLLKLLIHVPNENDSRENQSPEGDGKTTLIPSMGKGA
jgi:hypothetical protein